MHDWRKDADHFRQVEGAGLEPIAPLKDYADVEMFR